MANRERPSHYPNTAMFMKGDCVDLAQRFLDDESIQLVLCDPPFGIQETEVENAYNRDSSKVIRDYVEAPEDYWQFTLDWMTEAKRVLRPDGSLYVVIGHTPLIHVLKAAENLDLITVNHIIWTHNFSLPTRKHFSTCHYHVLFYAKTEAPLFNTYCRFGPQAPPAFWHSSKRRCRTLIHPKEKRLCALPCNFSSRRGNTLRAQQRRDRGPKETLWKEPDLLEHVGSRNRIPHRNVSSEEHYRK
jgi:hypothetical protein